MAKIDSRGRVIQKKAEPKPKDEDPLKPVPHDQRRQSLFKPTEPHDMIWDYETRPQQYDFVLPGFLAGTVGTLIAPGATGKSYLALEIATAIASGGLGDPAGIRPTKGGKVLYLASEDPDIVLSNRNHSIGQYLSQEARQAVAANLQLRSIVGIRFDVMNDDHVRDLIDLVIPPPPDDENDEHTENTESDEPKQPKSEYRLIILDTLSRIHRLDENSNADMAMLLAQLEHIARQTGSAILVLHHTSKAAARDGQLDAQQAARGASSLIDNSRWCGYVAKMTKEEAQARSIDEQQRAFYIRYGISKQNYSEPIDDKWLRRAEGGVLLPTVLPEPKAKPKKDKGSKKEEANPEENTNKTEQPKENPSGNNNNGADDDPNW